MTPAPGVRALAEATERERVADIMGYPRTVFVFGSNEAGKHGAGAAREAHRTYGAIWGVGFGPKGRSFAIPTKDARLVPLPLTAIREYVSTFLDFADKHPDWRFAVTRIGCGLAGYTDTDIAPMFAAAPGNCELPDGWRVALSDAPDGGGAT